MMAALCWQLVSNGCAHTGAKIGFSPQEAMIADWVTQNEPRASLVPNPLAARLYGPPLSHMGNT